MCGGMVDVFPVLDSDQVGHLRGVIRTAIETGDCAYRVARLYGVDLRSSHGFQTFVDVVRNPWNAEVPPRSHSRRIAGVEKRRCCADQLSQNAIERVVV